MDIFLHGGEGEILYDNQKFFFSSAPKYLAFTTYTTIFIIGIFLEKS